MAQNERLGNGADCLFILRLIHVRGNLILEQTLFRCDHNLVAMKLVSACLLGVNCNYEAKNWLNPDLLKQFAKGELFPVCPEILGGLPVPRVPAEIQGGDGSDVLDKTAKVVNEKGADVTSEFVRGAFTVLGIAQQVGAKEVLFTERSPSCGCGKVFDGSFSCKFRKGDGVTVALLKRNEIKVTSVKVS